MSPVAQHRALSSAGRFVVRFPTGALSVPATASRVESTAELPTHYWIGPERFGVEFVEGRVVLEHPHWSLGGSGLTVAEARASLMREARDVYASLVDVAEDELSDEAMSMFQFVKRCVERRAC